MPTMPIVQGFLDIVELLFADDRFDLLGHGVISIAPCMPQA